MRAHVGAEIRRRLANEVLGPFAVADRKLDRIAVLDAAIPLVGTVAFEYQRVGRIERATLSADGFFDRRAGHGWSRGVEPLAVVEEEQGGARLVALGRFRRFHVMVPQ